MPATTHNLEALLERTQTETVAEWIDSLPRVPVVNPETGKPDRLNLVKAILAESYGRDRAAMAAVKPMGPDSMVGSYFRAPDNNDPNAENEWLAGEPCAFVEGIVVSQPFSSTSTAIYTVEFYGKHGTTARQELVDLDRMIEQKWTFFDSASWLRSGQRQMAIETSEVTS